MTSRDEQHHAPGRNRNLGDRVQGEMPWAARRLSERTLKRVTVTKRGKPVAVLTPPKAAKEKNLPSIFGCLKDRTFVPPGYDLTKPVFEEEWDAEKGILHR
jgi:hypothetical protein